jgi:hypothetical protein
METSTRVLPQNSEAILQLSLHIVARHLQDGVESPLKIHHVAEINAKASAAQRKHEEALRFLKFAQELFKERDQLLGLSQPEFTPNNILYYLQSVHETLLDTCQEEEELVKWGFPRD